MCVALPGTVIRTDEKTNTARVDFSGNMVDARMGLVSVKPGDRVLVHAGCIMQRLSESEADEIEELLKEMDGV